MKPYLPPHLTRKHSPLRWWLLILLALMLGGCSENMREMVIHQPEPGEKVCALLAGDSWSMFDAYYQTTQNQLQLVDQSCRVAHGVVLAPLGNGKVFEMPTVIPGARVDQWDTPAGLALLFSLIEQNQDNNFLILYLGGNDFIRYYNAGQTQAGYECKAENHKLPNGKPNTNDNVNDYIAGKVEAVALAARAYAASRGRDLKVVIMGYTRLNFVIGEGVQPKGTGWWLFENQYSVSRGFWEAMGCPSMAQLDEAYLGLDARLKDFAAGKGNHLAHAQDVVQDLQQGLTGSNLTAFELNPKLAPSYSANSILYSSNFEVLPEGSPGASPRFAMYHQTNLSGPEPYGGRYCYSDSIHLAPPAQTQVVTHMLEQARELGWTPK